MTELNEVYRCEICGNMVEMVHGGKGQLVCCGEPMKNMVENTVDASKEKHIPIVEKTSTGILVKVGSVAHPMEEKHYIEWIEVLANGRVMRAHLQPGMKPEAAFTCKGENFSVRGYCNLHGLWRSG
ncbi:MAG: desulfoferrodoxin [Euryarchaeota archaeon]|nr:desulfoferrodoxin [Euryarchaeota archaeon]